MLFTPSWNYLSTPNFLISWWHWRALRRWFCGGFGVIHYCVSITERSTPLHARSLPSLFITIKYLICIFAMLNPGSKMLTGCGLNYKTFVRIPFLIFQFDHFGRWVPKKIFYLDMLRFTKHNLQPLVSIILVKFPHSPILHYAFSSWIEKTTTKTIHCHWENRFVLQYYGAVWKLYHYSKLMGLFDGGK